MEPGDRSQIPWILKRKQLDENFVHLHFVETTDGPLTRQYLERQVLRAKSKKDCRVDTYVMNSSNCNKTVQFYMNVHSPTRITYLTAQHFTLGLLEVAVGTEHVVKNLAHATPIYLFTCSKEKSHLYLPHSSRNKSLINKTWIVSDFQQRAISAMETVRIPERTVYFLFTVSHSTFVLERVMPDSKPKLEGGPSEGATTNQESSAPTGSDTLRKLARLDSENNELLKKNEELQRTIEDLERKNRTLSSMSDSLRGELRAASDKIQILERKNKKISDDLQKMKLNTA